MLPNQLKRVYRERLTARSGIRHEHAAIGEQLNQRGRRAAPDGIDRQTDCAFADRPNGLRNGSGGILEDNVSTSLFEFIDEFRPPNEIDGPKATLLRDRDQ
jgi:hypothetical protein